MPLVRRGFSGTDRIAQSIYVKRQSQKTLLQHTARKLAWPARLSRACALVPKGKFGRKGKQFTVFGKVRS